MLKELNIFFSYGVTNANVPILEAIHSYLSNIFKNSKENINIALDRYFLKTSDFWNEEITTHLNKADIVLFFISKKFIDSNFAIPNELIPTLNFEARGRENAKKFIFIKLNRNSNIDNFESTLKEKFEEVNPTSEKKLPNLKRQWLSNHRAYFDYDEDALTANFNETQVQDISNAIYVNICALLGIKITENEIGIKDVVISKLPFCGRSDNKTKLLNLNSYKINYQKNTTPTLALFAEDKQKVNYFFKNVNRNTKAEIEKSKVRAFFPENIENHSIETCVYYIVDQDSIENNSYITKFIALIQKHFHEIIESRSVFFNKVYLPIILKIQDPKKKKLIERILCSLTDNSILAESINTNTIKIDFDVIMYLCICYNDQHLDPNKVKSLKSTLGNLNSKNDTFEIDTLGNLKSSEVDDWLKLRSNNQEKSISEYIISYSKEMGNQTTDVFQAINIPKDDIPFIELENKLIQFFS